MTNSAAGAVSANAVAPASRPPPKNDTSRAAFPNYVAPDPIATIDGLFSFFRPPAGTSYHPLNPNDARYIQSRLFEFGYYQKPGDGIWGFASR
jgi:hypothetical protein